MVVSAGRAVYGGAGCWHRWWRRCSAGHALRARVRMHRSDQRARAVLRARLREGGSGEELIHEMVVTGKGVRKGSVILMSMSAWMVVVKLLKQRAIAISGRGGSFFLRF